MNQDPSQVMPGASFSIIFLQDLHGFSKRQSEMTTFNGYLATDNHTVNHNIFLIQKTNGNTKYFPHVKSSEPQSMEQVR